MTLGRGTAAVLVVLAMLGPAAAARSGAGGVVEPPAVAAAFARDAGSAGPDGVAHAVAARASALRDAMRRIPSGRAGLPSWVALGAELHGSPPDTVTVTRAGLVDAILELYASIGRPVDAGLRRAIAAQTRGASAAGRAEAARLIGALAAAARLTAEAIEDTGIGRWAARPGLALVLATMTTGPRADDVRRAIARVDMSRMSAAASVLAGAVAATDPSLLPDLDLPLIFIGGQGKTKHTADRVLLVDKSGNDTYLNNAGGGALTPALAWDVGTGNDRYTRTENAQGSATATVGILLDEGGRDAYTVTAFGQGSSAAGIGILHDAGGGNDSYLSPRTKTASPIATKASALGGIGMLIDEGGADTLRQDGLDGFVYGAAGGLALLANLGPQADSYRSDAVHAVLLSDEECQAVEGIVEPCPIDLGTFAGPVQVSAEVAGAAILYEEGGNDRYRCGAVVRQGCQGASGLDSLALLWDDAGNDTYWMGRSISDEAVPLGDVHPALNTAFPMGQGAAYAFGAPSGVSSVGILLDASGNDRYTAQRWAQGYGTFGAVGVLIDDGGGRDTYRTTAPIEGARTNASTWFDGLVGVGVDR